MVRYTTHTLMSHKSPTGKLHRCETEAAGEGNRRERGEKKRDVSSGPAEEEKERVRDSSKRGWGVSRRGGRAERGAASRSRGV